MELLLLAIAVVIGMLVLMGLANLSERLNKPKEKLNETDGRSFINNMYEKYSTDIYEIDIPRIKTKLLSDKVHTLENVTFISDGANYHEPTIEDYKANLNNLKKVVDETPREWLEGDLKNAIEYEHYELARYISDKIKSNQCQ